MNRMLQRPELGAKDYVKGSLFGAEEEERKAKLLSKCMSELTLFFKNSQSGLMPDKK